MELLNSSTGRKKEMVISYIAAQLEHLQRGFQSNKTSCEKDI